MARVLFLLVALLLTTACASKLLLEEDGALAVIPHETTRSGHIVVETMIDGQGPFRFALDTGATISVIYERALSRIEIEPIPGLRARVLGMTGTGEFPVATAGQITVGQETWENARVALLPNTSPAAFQVDGILGIDFMRRYAVWYSQQDRVLRLYPEDLVAEFSYNGWTSLKLKPLHVALVEQGVLAFDIYIQGERIPTLFDLGSNANLMNVEAARKLKIPLQRPEAGDEVSGIVGSAPVLAELRVVQLQIDNRYWRNRRFLVGEFPVFDALGIDNRTAAIAGTGFFRQRDFIIDFARERLLVRTK